MVNNMVFGLTLVKQFHVSYAILLLDCSIFL